MPLPSVSDASEQIKWRKPRNQLSHLIFETDHHPEDSQIPSIVQSTRCKSTISSLLLSTFSNNTTTTSPESNNNNKKKKNTNFSTPSFRGFGCTAAAASQQVSVPAVIRSSADWRGTKTRKKKHKRNAVVDGSANNNNNNSGSVNFLDFQDVWCGPPGLGFSADVTAPAVDCVTARKNVSASRGKIDVEKTTQRERRRTVNPESIPFLNSDSEIFRSRLESLGPTRYYRHLPHPSPDGFAQMIMLQGSLLMGGMNSHDHFRDLRLDVDGMSYEQLLELGERIGYVNTGLKDDEIGRCTRKFKLSKLIDTSEPHLEDKKCSICQEEFEADDEVGRLKCEHSYHFHCLRQWLAQKNCCPVCKQEVVVRHSVAKY